MLCHGLNSIQEESVLCSAKYPLFTSLLHWESAPGERKGAKGNVVDLGCSGRFQRCQPTESVPPACPFCLLALFYLFVFSVTLQKLKYHMNQEVVVCLR